MDRRIKSFVRRGGRMSPLQRRAIEKFSAFYLLPYKNEILKIDRIFENSGPFFLEIGFGMGFATALIAEKNRDKNYIGIEVHMPGVGKLLDEINKRELKNLKIISHDAFEVVNNMIPDKSLSGVHVFFPDPWPKKKHHKRRLVKEDFVNILIPKLKSGGYIYVATDWEPYAKWITQVFDGFEELYNPYNGSVPDINWRPVTPFEHKGTAKGRSIHNIWYEKR